MQLCIKLNLAYSFILVIGILGLAACGNDSHSQGASVDESKPDFKTGLYLNQVEEECNQLRETGCIAGQIAHATDIKVDGKEFFDVDELAEYFSSAITIKDVDGKKLHPSSYSAWIADYMNNENFADSFKVAAAGDQALGDSNTVGRSGNFLLSKLPVGQYEIRVYKRFDSIVSFDSGEERNYCVTIYQE